MGLLDYNVEIPKIICSTNAIESLNAHYRRAVQARAHFPTEQAALKCRYLVTRSLTDRTRPGTLESHHRTLEPVALGCEHDSSPASIAASSRRIDTATSATGNGSPGRTHGLVSSGTPNGHWQPWKPTTSGGARPMTQSGCTG
jgi:hypothetical protein